MISSAEQRSVSTHVTITIASGTNVNTDTLLLVGTESIENSIVDADEFLEQLTCRIDFERESRLGEIHLNDVSALL